MRPLMPPVQTPDNLFHDGNPLTGELGPIVDAEHLNNEQAAIRDTQSELIAILTAAAMEPESTAGQLLVALNKLYAPLNDTLGALSSLVGGANKLPYFTASNAAALTALSSIGRDIIGKATVADVLTYLGLTNAIIGDTCKEAGFYLGSELAPYLMHEDTHTAIRLVTLDSVRRVTTTTYTINYYANGLIHILGMTPTVSSLTPKTMTFPVAFPNACIRFALHNQESGVPSYNMAMYSNLSRTGAKIWGVANILGNSGSPTLGALPDAEISYEAWGY